MNTIGGIPYIEASFDEKGTLQSAVTLPGGVTDLLVIAHGWNNDADEARALYRTLFENFSAVATAADPPGRRFAILGVIWPSKKFDELVAVSGVPASAGGAAGLAAADTRSQQALDDKLTRMHATFTSPRDRQTIEEARALLPDLEDRGSARRAFVEKVRSLLDSDAADKEDASATFFKEDGDELMKRLRVDEDDLDSEVADAGGAMSLNVGGIKADGGAAGLKDVLSGFKASAMNVLNYTTYYVMKARAGTVGKNGVAKLLDTLEKDVMRIHLIGHSFGGRVVAATAAFSKTTKIRSMALLQAAFSHNGFSKKMGGGFRGVIDGRRIDGPIVLTHTRNDKAVGVAYPLASRINGDTTAAFGDEHDRFGGLGRNGAQQMEKDETVVGTLLPAGGHYSFTAGKLFNLEGSSFITGHSAVTGKEIAHALRVAIR